MVHVILQFHYDDRDLSLSCFLSKITLRKQLGKLNRSRLFFMIKNKRHDTDQTYLCTKSSVTCSKSGTAALAASGAINALDTFDLNLDHGSPCLREQTHNLVHFAINCKFIKTYYIIPYTPIRPGSSPKKSFLKFCLQWLRHGALARCGIKSSRR